MLSFSLKNEPKLFLPLSLEQGGGLSQFLSFYFQASFLKVGAERSKIWPYLQANELAYYSFIYACEEVDS